MRLLPFVALAALAVVSGHICSINPRQRGTFDISQPGSSACIRYKTPCGGQPSADPVKTVTNNKFFKWEWQQNLNHYSIGSPGHFEFSISFLADPQSDADFEYLGRLPDYPAYHQFTQTNMSAYVSPPAHGTSDHGVLRMKYVSNKPTEPTFIQCIDVKIVAADDDSPIQSPSVRWDSINGQPVPVAAAVAAPVAAAVGDPSIGTIVGVSAGEPPHVLSISPEAGTQATLGYLPYPVGSDDAYVAGLNTVNRKTQEIFLLYAPNGSPPTEVHVYDVSKAVGTKFVAKYKTSLAGVGYPASGIHYDSQTDALIVVGFQPDNSTWSLRVTSLNYRTGAAVLISASGALEPFVDFVWSDLHVNSRSLFVLIRHEDEPTSLPAKVLTFNLKSAGVTTLDVPSTYTFSTFYVKPQSDGAAIQFFTPGAVNADTGLIEQPNWQVVTMDIKSGAFTVVADFPEEVNALPIYWGGGVASFDADSGDSLSYLFVPIESNIYPNPRFTQVLAYDYVGGGTSYFDTQMLFASNTAIFGNPA